MSESARSTERRTLSRSRTPSRLSVEPCHTERPKSARSTERRTLSRSKRRTLSRGVIRFCSCRTSDPVTFSVESCHVERRSLSRSASNPVTRGTESRGNKGGFQARTEKQGIRVQILCFHAPGDARALETGALSRCGYDLALARGLGQIHCSLVVRGGSAPDRNRMGRITNTLARVLVDRRSLIGPRSI